MAISQQPSSSIDFANDIQTILTRKCYACHGPDLQEGSIRFDDRQTLLAEADSGLIAIAPGDAEKSELLRRVATDDESERMPPEGKPLNEEEIALLSQWINEGAEFENHWAFQPVQDPPLPDVDYDHWASGAIDHFVAARLSQAGLRPVTKASPATLVRRLYLDVTGLPPSPEVVKNWVEDWSDDSYEQLVDQLLSDPAFGDRWARMWLDVVRFAETNSYERDGPKPNAWKYRDYVIRAMNGDKPYDQFIREQIAGDELDEVNEETLTATGYYRLGLWDDEPADPKQALFDGFDDLVTTTSQGMLGLTLNCARCHDHKIDPLTQKDYYAMVAFMRDVTPYATRSDQRTFSQIELDPELAKKYEELASQKREAEKAAREIEQEGIREMAAEDQRATEGPERKHVLKTKLKEHLTQERHREYVELQKQIKAVNKEQRELPQRETVLGLAKLVPNPDATHILHRGSPHSEGDLVDPTFPQLLGGGAPAIPDAPEGARSAGRRKVLADWLASKSNWMTARVIVNRLWLHYFGRGIVGSPNNFGLMGETPSHPLLIDHLATELMRHDWSLKQIHRQILLSSTYQLAVGIDENADAKDPSNRLLWRQNLRRLSAEQVRDSVLTVTGQLNEQRYGSSMYPTLSAEVLASQSRPGSGWGNSSQADQARRSIYIHVKRSLPVPMMSAFDFPDTDISCEARFLTTQPGQALTMLNSDWMQSQAGHLQRRVAEEVGDDLKAQVKRCLELTTTQPPQDADVDELIRLVKRLKSEHELNEQQARHAMCLVALNLNQFFYLD